MASDTPMMAMTTSSSTSVKPWRRARPGGRRPPPVVVDASRMLSPFPRVARLPTPGAPGRLPRAQQVLREARRGSISARYARTAQNGSLTPTASAVRVDSS